MQSSPLTIMVLLKAEFERQNVPYLVGGSVASSVYGVPRMTRDEAKRWFRFYPFVSSLF